MHGILNNEKYTGVYVFNKSQRKGVNGKRNGYKQKYEGEIIRVEDGMPQIIGKEVFKQAQEMMQKRKDAYGNDYISYRCGCRKV